MMAGAHVPGDCKQPSGKSPTGTIASQIHVSQNEGFLEQILGFGTGASLSQKMQHRGLKPSQQLSKAGLAPLLGAAGKILVARRCRFGRTWHTLLAKTAFHTLRSRVRKTVSHPFRFLQ
jgi:hypothetical protein